MAEHPFTTLVVGDIGVNCYLVPGPKSGNLYIIDPGDDAADIIRAAADFTYREAVILLTHAHFDHIYGANALYKAYPQCHVFTSDYGREALYSDKKNFSLYHESSFVFEGKDVSILKDGDIVEIYPGKSLAVYATPGHCQSCLTYMVGAWVFTGDSYIPGVKVVTVLPKSDRTLAKQSKDRIFQLAEGKTICPGHGDMV